MSKIKFRVLNIDALSVDDSWIWNESFVVGEGEFAEEDLTTRKILRWMRDNGFLTENSKGRVRVDEYGEGSYEIQLKNTCEPIYALEKAE